LLILFNLSYYEGIKQAILVIGFCYFIVYNDKFILILMDLGAAIAIYVSIAIVLMIIFCLIAKYFNYRLNKAMNDAN
jgi:energy-converting hydrogenase Eha subunit G